MQNHPRSENELQAQQHHDVAQKYYLTVVTSTGKDSGVRLFHMLRNVLEMNARFGSLDSALLEVKQICMGHECGPNEWTQLPSPEP